MSAKPLHEIIIGEIAMKILRNTSCLALAVILIFVSGCATHRTTNSAGTNIEQTNVGTIADAEGMIGPDACVKPAANNIRWWEYALVPITFSFELWRIGQDLPGVGM
jgi:hypothetical protein